MERGPREPGLRDTRKQSVDANLEAVTAVVASPARGWLLEQMSLGASPLATRSGATAEPLRVRLIGGDEADATAARACAALRQRGHVVDLDAAAPDVVLACGSELAAAVALARACDALVIAVVQAEEASFIPELLAAGAHEVLLSSDSDVALTGRVAVIEGRIAERSDGGRAHEKVRRLLKAVETMGLGVSITDLSGRLLYANEAEAHMHGYALDEYLQIDVRALSPPSDWRDAKAPAPASRFRRWERDRVRSRKDGSTFPVHLCSDVVFGPDGATPDCVVTTCEDISDKRRAEEAALAIQERYRRFFEGHLAGSVILDLDGVVADCNPAFERLVGVASHESAIGRSLASFLRDAGQLETLRSQLSAVGHITRLEMELTRVDGTSATVLASLVSSAGAADAPGSAPTVMGFFVDITEQKLLEAQLRQALKMDAVGKLAGGVAHDFNNFLVVMGGYAEQLLETLDQSDPRHRWAGAILRSSEKASNLTRQLLAFSRRDVVQPRVLQIDPVVQDVVSMVGRLLGPGVQVEVQPGARVANVNIDPGQFEQVLINLAVNARDAMTKAGGRITIATRNATVDAREARRNLGLQPGDYVLVEVSDTGCGMTPETVSRIFEPFFTTKPVGQGTGLGLAMVYGIVKQAGGYTAVQSLLDEGTTFRIYLPAVTAPVEVVKEAGAAATGVGSGVVLLVEDDAEARALVAQMLRRRGYTVIEAAGPYDAVAVCQSAQPLDLMVTDVVMPHMSGPELVDVTSKLRPGLPVLYMTGYTDHDIGFGTVIPADVSLLRKPFRSDTLARRVGELIAAARGN